MRKTEMRNAGFTLLEAVVALTVVGLVGIAALGTVGAEFRTADAVQRHLVAAALAEERLAAVRLLDDRDLAGLPDSLARGTFAAPFAEYAWEAGTRVAPEDRALVDATVRVSWPRGAYALETRLYRPPRRPAVP
jgi:type II secretory pathway pseudopilin PulG